MTKTPSSKALIQSNMSTSPSCIAEFLAKVETVRAMRSGQRDRSGDEGEDDEGLATTNVLHFEPKATVQTIEAFESANNNNVTLPEDYRDFLLFVGNGGDGPAGFTVGLGDNEMPTELPQITVTVISKDGNITGSAGTGPRPPVGRNPDPARPFPFDAEWRAEDPLPFDLADAHPYDGCLYLANEGCGYFYFLVITGPHAGEVWEDDSAAYYNGSIGPTNHDFRAWYEKWVEGMLRYEISSAVSSALHAQNQSRRHHEHILRWAYLLQQATSPEDIRDQAMLELYLGRRDSAIALLDDLETNHGSDTPLFNLDSLRRAIYAADFERAESDEPSALAMAATHKCAQVRTAVARNPDAPPDVLASLGTDSDPGVRLALAQHPSTPWPVLEQAFKDNTAKALSVSDKDTLIALEAIVRHPSATTEVADALARFNNGALSFWAVRAAALTSLISVDALTSLATHAQPVVRQAVALNERTPDGVIRSLAKDTHWAVRFGVASRPSLPISLLEQLAKDPRSEVRATVACHPKCTVDLLLKLAKDHDYEVLVSVLSCQPRNKLPDKIRKAVSKHPSKPEAVLKNEKIFGIWKYLGASYIFLNLDATSAMAIADKNYSHPAYPEPLIERTLSSKPEPKDTMFGYQAAKHPFLQPHTLAKLAKDEYSYSREAIARREDCPPGSLELLAQDDLAMVRGAAAKNPNLPRDIWEKLVKQEQWEVRAGCAQNTVLATAADLAMLATDPEVYVRRAVLMNPKVPVDIVKMLAKDRDPEVKRWAVVS